MDVQQFDRMTASMTAMVTRRRFGMILAALGLVASAGASGEVAAKRKRRRKKRRKNACPRNASGKHQGVCVQHCQSFEDCPAGDYCGQPYGAEAGTMFCGAYEEPFCRIVPDDVTCGVHADCNPGQLCVFTACFSICVTPTFT